MEGGELGLHGRVPAAPHQMPPTPPPVMTVTHDSAPLRPTDWRERPWPSWWLQSLLHVWPQTGKLTFLNWAVAKGRALLSAHLAGVLRRGRSWAAEHPVAWQHRARPATLQCAMASLWPDVFSPSLSPCPQELGGMVALLDGFSANFSCQLPSNAQVPPNPSGPGRQVLCQMAASSVCHCLT